MFRGIFDFVDHPMINGYRDLSYETWVRRQSPRAPYGVPRFTSRDDAVSANATLPQTHHQVVVDNWAFLSETVIPFVTTCVSEARYTYELPVVDASDVFFYEDDDLITRVSASTDAKIMAMSAMKKPTDVRATLSYLWNHMRCGILVVVKDGAIVVFCPFYNPDFVNTWPPGTPNGADLFSTGSSSSSSTCLPVHKWWANGGILCNEAGQWGAHFNMQIKDMIAEAVHKYNVRSAIFCVNKRDYPQYKYNESMQSLMEPYGFIYDRDDRDAAQDIPLPLVDVKGLLPMLSFYGTSTTRFLDLLVPPTEDWEAANGYVYLGSLAHVPMLARNSIRELSVPSSTTPVAAKRPVAFFRGAATGAGTSPLTNQRLRLFSTAQRLKSPLLDVACVSLNKRLRKHYSEPVSVVDERSVGFPVSDTFYVPMSEQVKNKYLIYVEGHCAACRLGIMLASGSVVIKVKSSVPAPDLWYTHMLHDGVEYVSVREDLSDLISMIEELEADPVRCQRIADAARLFWQSHLSSTQLTAYLGVVTMLVCVAQED
jgi:hypothetical protein